MRKINKKYEYKKMILLGLTITTFVFTGCAIKKEESIVTKETETETYKEYDVLDIAKDFTLDGKKIGFPFELEDLPENYVVQLGNEEKFDYESLEGRTELDVSVSNEEGYMSIHMTLRCRENENLVDDGKICYVSCTTNDTQGPKYDFSIDGIGNGNTIEEAIEKFGEPSIIYQNGATDEVSIVYRENDETDLTIIASDGENIDTMYIYFMPN